MARDRYQGRTKYDQEAPSAAHRRINAAHVALQDAIERVNHNPDAAQDSVDAAAELLLACIQWIDERNLPPIISREEQTEIVAALKKYTL